MNPKLCLIPKQMKIKCSKCIIYWCAVFFSVKWISFPLFIVGHRHEIKQTCLHPPVCFIRPFLDEPFTSEPKRATLESSVSFQPPDTSDTCKPPLDSAAELFPGQSERQRHRFSLSVQEEPNKRKREEVEDMEELESIMSVDMDFFDELPAVKSPQAQTLMQSTHEKTYRVHTAASSSSSKRQRLHFEEDGTDRRHQQDVKNENTSETPEQHVVSIKTEEPPPLEHSSTCRETSNRPQSLSSSNRRAFEDVQVRGYFHLTSNHIVNGHIFNISLWSFRT